MPRVQEWKCYFGCFVDGPLHRFPQWEDFKEERFNKWKSVLDPVTQAKGNEYIYNNIRLCYRHFSSIYHLPSNRLTRNATPTLNISGSQVVLGEPSTSGSQITEEKLQDTSSFAVSQENNAQPSTSSINHKTHNAEASASNVCCKRLSNIVVNLRKKLKTMRSKYLAQKRELLALKKINLSKFSDNEEMPKTVQTFLTLQLKYKNKPKGRRFSNEEKIMALDLMKQNPKAYKYLQEMLIAPSKRTLQRLEGLHSKTRPS
ncbi:uncharacterized protein LOC119839982 [Zerene cesonia]|uniref:uncharacterized protein LOC119839982 n=1 Tax=Zerene cesonia TaxID=33412 RepID=UPI0018E57D06|nr:uncharacterized protein LOC119839982 [Zerene cesonia]